MQIAGGSAMKGLAGLFALAAAAPVLAQDETSQLRKEVQELSATVKALQAEVRELKAERAPQARQPAPAPPAPALPPSTNVAVAPPASETNNPPDTLAIAGVQRSPLPRQKSVSGNAEAASRIDNEAPPTDPDLAGFLLMPGTQTLIRLSGYAKLDMLYDTHQTGDQDQFVTSGIPVPKPRGDTGNFNMHARQTRFSLEVRRPTMFGESMRFYFENDFFGGSNGDYQFHLRQAFGQLGNTYAGFGFSAFQDPDAFPDTLDFAGPGGIVSIRQPGIHQAFRLDRANSLTIALEKPSSEVRAAGAAGADAPRGTQRLPDLIVAGRTQHGWGHLQLGAVLRQLGYATRERNDRALGYGVSLGGAIETTAIETTAAATSADILMFGGGWGKGIAHYLNDTGGQGLDAAVGPDGKLHALKGWGAYAGYTHHWNGDWRSNLVYGVARIENSPWLDDAAFRTSNYAAANLIWSPVPTLTVGLELLHGRLREQSARSNDDTRVQGSLQYSFVK